MPLFHIVLYEILTKNELEHCVQLLVDDSHMTHSRNSKLQILQLVE